MKIYTKTGDGGETSLFGGERVKKFDDRVDAYGTIDELNANIALLSDIVDDERVKNFLVFIENKLFDVGAVFAAGSSLDKINGVVEEDVARVEREIDFMGEYLPAMRGFILPGGCYQNSVCHIARTVCRRAERAVLKVCATDSKKQQDAVVFINRLSDYLFMLSRYISKQHGVAERLWNN